MFSTAVFGVPMGPPPIMGASERLTVSPLSGELSSLMGTRSVLLVSPSAKLTTPLMFV